MAHADQLIDPCMLDNKSLLNLIEEGVGPESQEPDIGSKDHEKEDVNGGLTQIDYRDY